MFCEKSCGCMCLETMPTTVSSWSQGDFVYEKLRVAPSHRNRMQATDTILNFIANFMAVTLK